MIYENEIAIGCGQDNDCTNYKIDILYSRKIMRERAWELGLQKPFRFKRSNIHWDLENGWLLGYLELVDKEGNILRSGKTTWLNLMSAENLKYYYSYYQKYPLLFKRFVLEATKLEGLREKLGYYK